MNIPALDVCEYFVVYDARMEVLPGLWFIALRRAFCGYPGVGDHCVNVYIYCML